MRGIKVILILAFLVLAGAAAWQTGAWEIANVNLREDLRDMASLAGTHMGVVTPKSDDQVIDDVIRKAEERGIELKPAQVTVRRIGSNERQTLYLAADYTVPVNLWVLSFRLHFSPTS